MRIIIAQVNSFVGDVQKNTNLIIEHYLQLKSESKMLIIFPELVLTGYLIQDAALSVKFLQSVDVALLKIAGVIKNQHHYLIVGAPVLRNNKVYNAAVVIGGGVILYEIYKKNLPNYDIFDEQRIFTSALPAVFEIEQVNIGLLICEDLWHEEVAFFLKSRGADLIVSINSSPFDIRKQQKRSSVIQNIYNQIQLPVIYVNRIGADDHLIFDGGSCIINNGIFIVPPHYWNENFIEVKYEQGQIKSQHKAGPVIFDDNHHIYCALMRGLGDFLIKNNFNKVVLGLSGGVDSSFVATLATDVFGPENVNCVAMPSMFSSEASFTDAQDLVKKLGCSLNIIPINEIYLLILQNLKNIWGNLAFDVTEENLQARIRGMLLMAIANKNRSLLLTTSNKSESAIGYGTLYGDMCGAIAPISDIYKTKLYEVAKWRNNNIPNNSKNPKLQLINENIIRKAPTAELRENQKDEDFLPPYTILDKILFNLIECNLPAEEIAADNMIELELVKKVEKMLVSSEFKRKQSAQGLKISTKMLGTERRFPVTFKH